MDKEECTVEKSDTDFDGINILVILELLHLYLFHNEHSIQATELFSIPNN